MVVAGGLVVTGLVVVLTGGLVVTGLVVVLTGGLVVTGLVVVLTGGLVVTGLVVVLTGGLVVTGLVVVLTGGVVFTVGEVTTSLLRLSGKGLMGIFPVLKSSDIGARLLTALPDPPLPRLHLKTRDVYLFRSTPEPETILLSILIPNVLFVSDNE